jgi:hypothetical protein
MNYSEQDDRITLEMSREDREQMTIILGYAIGAAFYKGDREYAYHIVAFVNRLYAGNPHFQPYEIPEEYRT